MDILIIRHAQSKFNEVAKGYLNEKGYQKLVQMKQQDKHEFQQKHKFSTELLDSPITQLGFQQCAQSKKIIQNLYTNIGIVIVSPLKRALQTCYQIFNDYNINLQIIVDPLFREVLESSCDIGTQIKQNKLQYSNFNWNQFESFTQGYPDNLWNIPCIQNQDKRKQVLQQIQKVPAFLKEQKGTEVLLQLMSKKQYGYYDQPSDLRKRAKDIKTKLKNHYSGLVEKGKEVCIVCHSRIIQHLTTTVYSEQSLPLNAYYADNCEVIKMQI